jgi:hypothetical protein
MNWDQIQYEEEAYKSVMALLEQARMCQQLHERAGLALPERVQRLLGLSSNGPGKPHVQARSTISIPPLNYPKPKDATGDWLSIDVKDAQATTVALAVLRGEGVPMRAKDVTAKVSAYLPNVTGGTLANAATRLVDEGIIERTEDGWKLLKPTEAGIIHEGRLWGTRSIFGKQELAAHRRESIIHILTYFTGGLQIVQIVEQLNSCAWMQAPANKDLLKADIEILAADKRKIRRVGNTRKWTLAQSEKGD